MTPRFSIAGHWTGDYDEVTLIPWIRGLRSRLASPSVTFGVVFMTPALFPKAADILELVRVHAGVPCLAGCSSTGLIASNREIEDASGLVLALYHLPGAEIKGFHFGQEHMDSAESPNYWREATGLGPGTTNGWLVFADPFNLDCETWLRQWDEAFAPLPVLGGLAVGDRAAHTTQVYLNGEVHEEGAVAISVGGAVGIAGVISQGCTPIGETWTITRVERNIIREIANRPAYAVLMDTFKKLPQDEQQSLRGNLFVGLVTNEYLDEFHRGDFLVRNLLGADPASGFLAIGALPRTGQTVQFQRRDAAAATEDLNALLGRAKSGLTGKTVFGGVLCCCNGRGSGLFGEPDHDARMIQDRIGPLGMAGFFCNGEIGPVGGKNFLHGYTASLALFVEK
jgi:small ligand-binding sensory domain FIST